MTGAVFDPGAEQANDGPTTTAPDCAAAGTTIPQTISAAASKVFMVRCEMYILERSKGVARPLLRIVSTTGRRRSRRIALTGLLAIWLLLGAAPSDAQPAVRQVLILQSFDRGTFSVDQFTSNFRVELNRRATEPVNVVEIVVGPTGFVGAPEQAVVDYIRATFVDRPKPDQIVTIAGPAAVFARRYRQQIFPDTPLLFASVDRRFLDDAPLGDKETAVTVENQFSGTVETILQLLPETRQVFMVMGSGPVGQFWRRELENQFGRFRDRLTFVWSNDLSLQEILRRGTSLPEHSAILYVSFGTDAAGAAFPDERLFAELHETANAPLFAGQNVYLGSGIVGGSLLSIDDLSRDTADVAVRLLHGAAPKGINLPVRLPGQPTFDWRELQKWRIPESRLPPGSIVRYRAPSLWSAYRRTVLTAVGVLAIQSLLIIGLLYQRRARRRAELESRNNLTLAADASRRLTMSALTSSIAHELGQPLSSMIHNAQAGRMMLTADRATPDTIGAILSDIETEGVQATQIIDRHRTMLRGRQLDTKPIDLHVVIHESLALVAHDMRTRQIEATVNLSSSPCIITGDEVLLQQVMVNLLMNAMDAMAETPPARRRVSITTDVRAAEVGVSVCDAGAGLPAQINGALFTPFVTTKAHGLGIGLTITQTIVDAHRGTIAARNNPEGGATFTVNLRRSMEPADVNAKAGLESVSTSP
jgi:signal transduction histidine kinase